MNFESSLKFGKTGESYIANYFRCKGYNILPVYEKLDNEYKGPTLFTATGEGIIAPDMLVFGKQTYWVEAKHKNAFTWHRNTQKWTTGIDAHHYQEYLKVLELSEWPIWLIFLHKDGIAKDTPDGMESPTGLYGNDLLYLSNNINHTHENWGKNGMVYWAVDKLKLLGNYNG